jgi:exodeoxyribonuclease VII large subunit
VLDRGYAIVRHGENVVRAADDVTTGDTIDVRVADGRFGATVE